MDHKLIYHASRCHPNENDYWKEHCETIAFIVNNPNCTFNEYRIKCQSLGINHMKEHNW